MVRVVHHASRTVERFSFDLNGGPITVTVYSARKPLGLSLLLGPGSDGSQRNPFIVEYATELARRRVLAVTYDFPYAAHGAKKPDRNEILKACCRGAIAAARECRPKNHLFVGGKSLGASISAQVVADGGEDVADVLGVVALGFPLHPVGRPDVQRDTDLRRLTVPVFFAQGTREVFGTPDELRPTIDLLPDGSELFVVPGGDHSFAVTARDRPQADVHASVADAMVQWMQRVAEGSKGKVSVTRAGRRPIAPHLRDQLRLLRRRAT
jgi:predicted alpha/beta-hydrolase family hydrolase